MACAGAVAVLSPLIGLGSAQAAHPGANGRIAFVRTLDGHSHLFTIHPDGTGEQQLTFAKSSDDSAPDWSPDGTKIAFERCCPGGYHQIYVIDASGAGPAVNISNSQSFDEDPSWGPNGRRLAFVRGSSIWRMRVDGTHQNQVTHSPYDDLEPSWSSTGDLAFTRVGSPGWQPSIYVRRFGSGTATRFVASRTDPDMYQSDQLPDWSPDGSELAYTEFRGYPDGTSSLLSTTDGKRSSAFDVPCGSCLPVDPAWSPDGRFLAFDMSTDPAPFSPEGVYTVSTCACDTGPTFVTAGQDPAWQPVQPS